MTAIVTKARQPRALAARAVGLARRALLLLGAGVLPVVGTLGAALGPLGVVGCTNQRTVLMHMQGEQTDALVTINDRYVGKLGEIVRRGIKLPPGTYRVTVEMVGYFPYDELLEVVEEPVTLPVRLVPIPD